MNKFVIGSNAFFSSYSDFIPHDNDTLILVDKPDGFQYQRQIRLYGNCIIEWKRMSADEFVNYHLGCNVGMFVGKFLVPEFVHEIGFTIEHLKQLKPLVEKLDEKHKYEEIIYNAYIDNNDFVLTDEQRLAAYTEYKKERTE